MHVSSPVDLQIINPISQIQQSDTVYVSNNSDVNLEYNRYYQPLYNITWLYPIQSGSPMAHVIPNINTSTNYTVVVFLNKQKNHSVEIQVKIVCKLSMFMFNGDLQCIGNLVCS